MLPFLFAGLGAGSSLLGAWQQYQSGQFDKQVAVANAEQMEQQARQVQQQAGADIAAGDVVAAQRLAGQVTRTAASGITEEGTPAFMMHGSEEEAALNDMYDTYAANMKANSLYYQASMTKTIGEQKAQAATIGAITSGTTGTIQAGMDAYQLKYGKF